MWQQLLDRLVPLLPAEPSRLDRLDGVGHRDGVGLVPAPVVVRVSGRSTNSQGHPRFARP